MKDKRKQQDEIIAFGNLRQYALETNRVAIKHKKVKTYGPENCKQISSKQIFAKQAS